MSREGLVLKGKWTLTSLIGKGACAEVWSVICSDKGVQAEGSGWVAKICAAPEQISAADRKKKRKASEAEKAATTLSWEDQLYKNILRDHPSVKISSINHKYPFYFRWILCLLEGSPNSAS